MGLVGSPSFKNITAPPLSVPAVAEPSVKMMNRVFRCLTDDREGMGSTWEPGGDRLCTFQLLESSKGQEKEESMGAL